MDGRNILSGEASLRTATPPPPVALHLFSSWALRGVGGGALTAWSGAAAKADVNL